MADDTHIPDPPKTSMTGVRGKAVQKVIYRRSLETMLSAERHRLGVFADAEPLKHPEVAEKDSANGPLLISCEESGLLYRIIRERLNRDQRAYKFMNGTQLLGYYFSKEEGREYFDAWTETFPQVFLTFGLGEAPNRRLADVIVETVATRLSLQCHIWVCMSHDLPIMMQKWGQALEQLFKLPRVIIPVEKVTSLHSGFDPDTTNIHQSTATLPPPPSSVQVPAPIAPPLQVTDPRLQKKKKDKWP